MRISGRISLLKTFCDQDTRAGHSSPDPKLETVLTSQDTLILHFWTVVIKTAISCKSKSYFGSGATTINNYTELLLIAYADREIRVLIGTIHALQYGSFFKLIKL